MQITLIKIFKDRIGLEVENNNCVTFDKYGMLGDNYFIKKALGIPELSLVTLDLGTKDGVSIFKYDSKDKRDRVFEKFKTLLRNNRGLIVAEEIDKSNEYALKI